MAKVFKHDSKLESLLKQRLLVENNLEKFDIKKIKTSKLIFELTIL